MGQTARGTTRQRRDASADTKNTFSRIRKGSSVPFIFCAESGNKAVDASVTENRTTSCLEARQPRRSRQKVCLTALGSHKPSVRPQHGLETVRSRPARIDTYFQPYNEKKYALLLAQSPTRLSTCRPHQSFRALVHSQSRSFVEGWYGQSIHLLLDHLWAVKLKTPKASEEPYLSASEGLGRPSNSADALFSPQTETRRRKTEKRADEQLSGFGRLTRGVREAVGRETTHQNKQPRSKRSPSHKTIIDRKTVSDISDSTRGQ